VDISAEFDEGNYICVSEQSFDASAIFKANAIFTMMIDIKGKLTPLIDITTVNTSRDGDTPLRMFYTSSDSFVLSLYFADTCTDNLIVSYLPTKTAEQYELRPINETFSEVICLKYPDYKKTLNLQKARQTVLYNLDPNDSIAYLEAQLDILNQLVFTMLDALPDVKKQVVGALPEYDDFKNCFADSNLMTVKPVDKCIAEIGATKAKVRQLQKTYYAIKADNQ
jgi:hypothetical protein